jgi:8-oxo-dGTP pyrophosphatase MutT (NUDIX family)
MPSKVLVIHKDKPAWQHGRINLPGGKIEVGELPHDAAKRELFEETGMECLDWPFPVGKIVFSGGVVHILTTIINEFYSLEKEAGNAEYPEWRDWPDLYCDKRMLPNLKVIIPLCQSGIRDWTLKETSFGDNNTCTMEISV